MSSFHLRFVGAGEQAGTANECGVCGEVTNGRVLRCQQAGFTLDSNRCDLHRNRDHPNIVKQDLAMCASESGRDAAPYGLATAKPVGKQNRWPAVSQGFDVVAFVDVHGLKLKTGW